MSSISTMEHSSRITASHSKGSDSSRLKITSFPSPEKPASRRRCMVEASRPVSSLMRLAARPVGAVSNAVSPILSYSDRIARIEVVLPVPGPPVITIIWRRAAFCRIRRCWGAKDMPCSDSI